MISALTMLMHLGATSRVRLVSDSLSSLKASDSPPSLEASDSPPSQKQSYMLEKHSKASRLLDEAEEKHNRYCELVELNLQRLLSTEKEFEVLDIEKGPNQAGYVKYMVTYKQTVREVFNLFYTVEGSTMEAYWLGQKTFLQDSLRDLFPTKKAEGKYAIVSINQTICWPRKQSLHSFCTYEVKFKYPELTKEETDAIDVNKTYTIEHEKDQYKGMHFHINGKETPPENKNDIDVKKTNTIEHENHQYKGMYFQINGKDAMAGNELSPLTTGEISQVCHLVVAGTSSPASHLLNKTKEVVALIFGGEPKDYIAGLQEGACDKDHACTVAIGWGVTGGCTMNNFAIKKSVDRANDNLRRLTTTIFQDGWTLTKISSSYKKQPKRVTRQIQSHHDTEVVTDDAVTDETDSEPDYETDYETD